jgi:hypothetical protein
MSAIKNISLYIPHIFANYSKDNVAQIFESQGIGKVSHIDFVSKLGHDGKEYNAAYIHFDHWLNGTVASNFHERVLNPEKEARLMYEDPWYWLVLENKTRKVVSGDRKPRIDLGSSSTPERPKSEPKCPAAPSKKSYANVVEPSSTGLDFEPYYADLAQELDEEIDDEANMDEIEALIEEEDKYLVQIDSRYVQSVEQENAELRATIAYFQNALCVEQIKTQALAEAIGKSK